MHCMYSRNLAQWRSVCTCAVGRGITLTNTHGGDDPEQRKGEPPSSSPSTLALRKNLLLLKDSILYLICLINLASAAKLGTFMTRGFL